MLKIKGYKVTEMLSQGKYFITYRGLRETDNEAVILKACRATHHSAQVIAILKQEYQLLKQLNMPQIIKPYELIKQQHQLVLVLADIGGNILREYLAAQIISFAAFSK